MEQTQLEQCLIEVLSQLPIPVRIERCQPEPGGGWRWYKWRCLGEMRECATFPEAVSGALHHLQRRLLADDPSRFRRKKRSHRHGRGHSRSSSKRGGSQARREKEAARRSLASLL